MYVVQCPSGYGIFVIKICGEQVKVEQGDEGNQKVHLHTSLTGKLILHWGVEGGQDYQGGWRLPGSSARPDGTTQYKDRALQTPWQYVLLHTIECVPCFVDLNCCMSLDNPD